jgi:O-Antigen ligase
MQSRAEKPLDAEKADANQARQASPVPLSRLTSDRTARRIAACCEAGLNAAAVLFFPLLVLVPRGVASLVSIAGLCGAGLVLSASGPRSRPALTAAAALLGSLLVWGTASAMWSVDWLRSLVVAVRLAGLFAVGLVLTDAATSVKATRRLTFCLLGGLTLGVAMAATDLVTRGALGAPFTERAYQPAALNRASVSFAILLLPMTVALLHCGLRLSPFLFATAIVAMIFALAGTTAKATLVAGLPIGLLLYLSRTRVAYAAAVVAVLVIITAPLTFARLGGLPVLTQTADAVKLSAGHRLLIWSFVGDRIAERPLAGWGLDSSRSIPGGQDLIRPGETWLPLHPHNTPLQLWLELGAEGAVLFALLVALAWFALASAPWSRAFGAAAGASLAIALIACLTTYGIWQEWWLGGLWFLLFGVLVMARVTPSAVPRAETAPLTRVR